MKRRLLAQGLLIVITLFFAASASGAAAPVATTHATTQPDLASEYANLIRRAEKLNSEHPQITRWSMNCEHCLLVDDEDAPVLQQEDPDLSKLLRGRVIVFVRRPGALDYIFSRLLDEKPPDTEVLAAAQLLIYAGECYTRADETLPPSTRASEVLNAAKNGRFSSAEEKWPEAPICEKIKNAARRAIRSMQRE